jgi:TolA-binding protein
MSLFNSFTMKNTYIILFLFAYGCSSLSDEQLWQRVESAKKNQNWDSTKQVCEKILVQYPSGKYASWARFGLAESYRFKNQPREALNNYKMFIEQYPDMQPSALSLFLVGYIYNNNLQVPDSAKIFYEKFLMKYPSHDLVPTVKFELENLGKDPSQVLLEKEQAIKKRMAKR